MREIVNNLQMSVLRYQLGTGEYPATPTEQAMTQEIEQLKLRAKQANQHDNQVCIAPTPLKCYHTGSDCNKTDDDCEVLEWCYTALFATFCS